MSSKLPKPNAKDLIRLYDQVDRPIGVKLKTEAEELARKGKFDLIEKSDRPQSKYKEFMLKSRIQELEEDAESTYESPSIDHPVNVKSSPRTHELKRLTFSAHISDHDFEYRFEHIVKLLQKNVTIRLLVTGKANGKDQLGHVHEKLQKKFGKAAKITQKVISGHNMKMTISPVPEELSNLILSLETVKNINQSSNEEKASSDFDAQEIDEIVKEMLQKKNHQS